MNLYLGTTDIAEHIKYGGYSVGYNKILGPNSFTTLDGTYHEDVIAKKVVVVAALVPITSAELSAILVLCDNLTTATYLDTKTNTYVTANVTATVSMASVVINQNNALYWGDSNGLILTLEEK